MFCCIAYTKRRGLRPLRPGPQTANRKLQRQSFLWVIVLKKAVILVGNSFEKADIRVGNSFDQTVIGGSKTVVGGKKTAAGRKKAGCTTMFCCNPYIVGPMYCWPYGGGVIMKWHYSDY